MLLIITGTSDASALIQYPPKLTHTQLYSKWTDVNEKFLRDN